MVSSTETGRRAEPPPRRRRGSMWAAVAVIAVAVSAGTTAWWATRGVQGAAGLDRQLLRRGRIGIVGGSDLEKLAGAGTTPVDVDAHPDVERALQQQDPRALVSAMDEAGLRGLLVDGRRGGRIGEDASLASRLKGYGYVPGLHGVHLAPAAALYERYRVPSPAQRVQRALGEVARGILSGKSPPRISSFPPSMRRIRSVEVMVMLRDGNEERLWRSARGSSIGKALITAASVARKRWAERETAMGGPLEEQLPQLDVEVSLLIDDGTLGRRGAGFLERAITTQHGIGYERKGKWRYLLPKARRQSGDGSAKRAFEQLFADNGLAPELFTRPDIRLYRLVVERLARSSSDPHPH